LGRESVSAIPASAGRQNRKIFVSLVEKILARERLKNVKKIFLFCSPSGERKRWVGLPPAGRQLKFAVRIFVKKGSDFIQKAPPVGKRSVWLARYAGSPAVPQVLRDEFFVFVPRSGTPEAGFSNFY